MNLDLLIVLAMVMFVAIGGGWIKLIEFLEKSNERKYEREIWHEW